MLMLRCVGGANGETTVTVSSPHRRRRPPPLSSHRPSQVRWGVHRVTRMMRCWMIGRLDDWMTRQPRGLAAGSHERRRPHSVTPDASPCYGAQSLTLPVTAACVQPREFNVGGKVR